MKATQILIAGFGGQGVLFAGKFLAYKGLMEDLQVSWLPSYGPEMRGGTANCSVVLSDSPVGSPIITTPDVLVAMNLPSLQKFVDSVVPGGQIYVDSALIDVKVERTDVEVFYIPATQLAKDAGAPQQAANMVLLGAAIPMLDIEFEKIEAGIRRIFARKGEEVIEKNLAAVRAGYENSIKK